MTHSYKVSGMTCNGCAAKVKHNLLLNPEITAADVLLDKGEVSITMLKHLSIAELQHSLGKGSYVIESNERYAVHASIENKPLTNWIITYKPLLIIAAFITGVAFLTSRGSLHTGMNHFMSGFFLVFSFFKLLDLNGFASSYAMYDLLAKKTRAYGFIYPFLELGLGIAYLTGYHPEIVNVTTIFVMGFSSIGVIKSVLSKSEIRCACLGSVFNLPMTTVTIIEDLLMVAMAIFMLFAPSGNSL